MNGETSKVYIIQHPQRNGVPLDVTDASRLGIVQKPIVRHNYNTQIDAADAVRRIEAALADYTEQDYLMCIGDPVLIGIATAIAARNTGGVVNLLKWNRRLDANGRRQRFVGHYIPCTVELDI